MSTPVTIFDNAIDQWRKELTYPWFQLKYKLGHANLSKHLPPNRPLSILDAGGGNGIESLPFAEAGNQVALVDYSQEMIQDARHTVEQKGLQEQVQLYQAEISQLPTLFPPATFDLLLCHNVLQYVDDVAARIGEMTTLLKPGGVASFVSINPYSRPYSAAFLRNDLETALREIGQRSFSTIVFQTSMTLFTVEEMSKMLVAAGFQVVADYGLLCMYSYWGDTARKSDPAIHAQLEALEFALTDKHPYKLLANNYQIIVRK